jgi:hypothetical protein
MCEVCSICREDMDDNKQHFMLRCNHRFHTECIVDSLRTNNECPICRDTNGNNKFISNRYDDYDTHDILNKKKICKSKIDDINNILKLMNDLIEGNDDNKKLKNDIKIQVKIFKKNTNILYRNIKSFQNKLDKKYKEDIKAHLLSITSTEDFEKGVISKNIFKEKTQELHRIMHRQILEMGIPNSALDSLKFNSIIKTQFEKQNDIYVDDYYNEIYSVINKNIKKVNNNIILTI